MGNPAGCNGVTHMFNVKHALKCFAKLGQYLHL